MMGFRFITEEPNKVSTPAIAISDGIEPYLTNLTNPFGKLEFKRQNLLILKGISSYGKERIK